MTDALDRRLGATNPATEADVAALDLGGLEAHLLEQIMGTFGSEQPSIRPPAGNGSTTARAAVPDAPAPPGDTAPAADDDARPADDDPVVGDRPPAAPSPFVRPGDRRRRMRPRVVAAAVAAVAVLAVGAVALRNGGDDDRATPAAGRTTTTAPSEPTLLDLAFLDESQTPTLASANTNWKITSVDVGGPAEGEITLSNGDDELQVTFHPAVELPDRLTDAYLELGGVQATNLVGQQASSFGDRSSDLKEPGAERYEFAVLAKMTITTIEVRGSFQNSPAFARAYGAIELVPPKEWLGMLPTGTVIPSQIEAATEELQDDIPVPAVVSRAGVSHPLGRGILSRYRFVGGIAVSSACSWVHAWYVATTRGDDEAAQEAIDGLRTLADWAPLREVADQGDVDEALRSEADALASEPSGTPGLGTIDSDVLSMGCGLPEG